MQTPEKQLASEVCCVVLRILVTMEKVSVHAATTTLLLLLDSLLPSLKRRTKDFGNCNRKHQIPISDKLALEVAMNRS
jgi:hypothetical protein